MIEQSSNNLNKMCFYLKYLIVINESHNQLWQIINQTDQIRNQIINEIINPNYHYPIINPIINQIINQRNIKQSRHPQVIGLYLIK